MKYNKTDIKDYITYFIQKKKKKDYWTYIQKSNKNKQTNIQWECYTRQMS